MSECNAVSSSNIPHSKGYPHQAHNTEENSSSGLYCWTLYCLCWVWVSPGQISQHGCRKSTFNLENVLNPHIQVSPKKKNDTSRSLNMIGSVCAINAHPTVEAHVKSIHVLYTHM